MPLLPGTRLGPYEIVAMLGRGGMGEVYQARDPRLGRIVAIKILPAELSADSDSLLRFEREARSASALNHPNIVTIYDLGKDGSTHYIAMELIEGKTLRELHDAGIAHRDLKPDNLMISQDGFIKILDFGLAKLSAPGGDMSETRDTSQWQTQPGAVMGTVQYMSPEQASGGRLDFRSDQFSFGFVLYEVC